MKKMKGIIKYGGFDILHRHAFHWVFYSAWKGQDKLGGRMAREIRKDIRFLDCRNPLTKEEKEWLIGGENFAQ
jgi:hypothetical protein